MSRPPERFGPARTAVRAGAAMVVLLFGAPAGLRASAPLLAPAPGGAIGAGVEERSRPGTRRGSVEPDRRLHYWLKLPLAGRLGNGRGLAYAFTIRPSAVRTLARANEPGVAQRELDYDTGVRLTGIPATALSASFARGRSRADRSGAPLTESDVASRSATLALAFRPLPLSADISERRSEQSWAISPYSPALRQAESSRTWRVSGQNSRTALRLDRTLHDDRSTAFDYETWNASAAHTLRWGKGSRLQSSAQRSRRDGASPYRQDRFEERLHLQHLRAFATDWSLVHGASVGAASPVRSRSLYGAFDHRAAPGVAWGASLASYTTRTDAIDTRALDSRAHVAFERRWRSGLKARASGDAGRERREDRGPSSVFLAAIGERHTVGASRSFTLDASLPDSSNVLVRGVDPPTTYLESVDYVLVRIGDRLEVRLTATTRMRVGEVVEVDYRYAATARPVGRATTARYQLAAEYGPLSLRHEQSNREATPGRSGALVASPSENTARTEFEARWNTPRGSLGLRARRDSRSSPRFEQRSTEAQAEWAAAWTATLRTTLATAWSRRASERGHLDVVSGDARAAWDARPWLRVGGQAQAFAQVRGAGAVDASLDADARVAAIELALRFRRQWATPPGRGGMQVLSGRLVRRF